MELKWDQRINEIASSMCLCTILALMVNCMELLGKRLDFSLLVSARSPLKYIYFLKLKHDYPKPVFTYFPTDMFDYSKSKQRLPSWIFFPSPIWLVLLCVCFPWKGLTSIQYIMINEACRQRDSWVRALQHTRKQLPRKFTYSSFSGAEWLLLYVIRAFTALLFLM